MQQNQEFDILAPTNEFPKRKFTTIRCLGAGAQGSVYLVRSENWGSYSNIEVALKFSYRYQVQQKEIEFLKNLQAYQSSEKEISFPSNIIRVLDFFDYNHSDQQYFVTVMEIGQNDLYNFLSQKRKTLTEVEKLNICLDITKPIFFLHSLQSIHRDVKTENFIQVGEKFKLIDFGSVKERISGQRMTIGVGTPIFQAPELVDGLNNYTEKVDIWALSCIFYEVFGDNALFNCQTKDEAKQKIRNHKINQSEIFDKIDQLNCNPQFKELMKQMLQPDPQKRIDSKCVIDQIQNLLPKNTNSQVELQYRNEDRNNQELYPQIINDKLEKIQNELKNEMEEKFKTLQLENQRLLSLQDEKSIQIFEESINKNMRESTTQLQKLLDDTFAKKLEQYSKKLQKQLEEYVLQNIEEQCKKIYNKLTLIIQEKVKEQLINQIGQNQLQMKMQEIENAVHQTQVDVLALQNYNNLQVVPKLDQLYEGNYDFQENMTKYIKKELDNRLNEINSIKPSLQSKHGQLNQFNQFSQFNNQKQIWPDSLQQIQYRPNQNQNQNRRQTQGTFFNPQDDRILKLEKELNEMKQWLNKLEQFSKKQKNLFQSISELEL